MEIARSITRERKTRANNDMKDLTLDTHTLIKSLRNIQQSNFMRQSIDNCNNKITSEYEFKSSEYKTLLRELTDSDFKLEE